MFAAGTASGALESRRTRLVQRSVVFMSSASAEFMDTGPDGDEVCIMVIPKNYACCFNTVIQVPSGPHILWSSFGKNMGKLDPGMKLCWPVWNYPSVLISKQVITYNAIPKSCPTKDMVFVDVNLSINLKIGPDLERVQTFVYSMGPARLDAYMHFEVEECLRALVHDVTYDKVNDLRSDFAMEMLRTLQAKLSMFGVDVLNVKITDVALPRELQQRLEKTTSFQTRMLEQEKQHHFQLQQFKNNHIQKMSQIEQETAIARQRIAAETNRYEVEQDEAMNQAASNRKVKMETARGERDVAITKAQGAVEVAQYEGRAEAEDMVSSTQIECEQRLRAAKLAAATALKGAEANKNSATFLASALLTEAKADGEAATQLEEKVKFTHQLRLAEIDGTFATRGRKFLAGGDGASIIKSFVMVRDELNK